MTLGGRLKRAHMKGQLPYWRYRADCVTIRHESLPEVKPV
ncbi:hypothetical protein ACPOL_4748 [Acidisarcina polymorpha]|uniref:Uncharacterized protein n=1 Tax=Acidisarcina polymorpha TaxID=2211140 RepID=A0A2Z5G635_9BACT|nr:hypothetical protein ACPOL_4748 [Acidisarcina polymorpha]